MPTELQPRLPGHRKTALVTIDADNRDQGKRYLLTEMSALSAEKWFRVLVAKLARDGMPLPKDAAEIGMAAIPQFPLLTYMSWVDDEALIGALMRCIQAWPEGAPQARPMMENDVEEVLTLAQLKMEVLALHLGFSLAGVLWARMPALAALMNLPGRPQPAPQDTASSDTPTSLTPSP